MKWIQCEVNDGKLISRVKRSVNVKFHGFFNLTPSLYWMKDCNKSLSTWLRLNTFERNLNWKIGLCCYRDCIATSLHIILRTEIAYDFIQLLLVWMLKWENYMYLHWIRRYCCWISRLMWSSMVIIVKLLFAGIQFHRNHSHPRWKRILLYVAPYDYLKLFSHFVGVKLPKHSKCVKVQRVLHAFYFE